MNRLLFKAGSAQRKEAMGTFTDSIRKGAMQGLMSYSGKFRYHADFGSGLVVSRLGIEVYEFDGTSGGSNPLNLYSGKDNSIVIGLAQARQSKRLALYMPEPSGLSTDPSWGVFTDVLYEMYRIRELKGTFFLSFAVQKNSNGKKIEMLVLQDSAAALNRVDLGHKAKYMVRFDFLLKSPTVKPVSMDR
ncbi:MAG TPA: hypothetical protein PKD24_11465 [Pyrinomonadaceae bacterium]|nr:hypothetical protein [Pyrinomonadaceae bacterium]HMP66134.1 hypothetical protein [Pyrinomonadaceae bacterium]